MKTVIFLASFLTQTVLFSQNNSVKSYNKLKAATDNTIEINSQKANSSQSLNNDIVLRLIANWTTDSIRITFSPAATSSYDFGLDLLKAMPTNTVDPYIASVCGLQDLAVNALPSSQMSVTIPIRVKVGITGKYILTMDSNLIMLSNACMMLEDLATATMQDFKANPSYSFAIADTTLAPRFLLHIGQAPVKTSFSPSCSYTQNGMAIMTGSGSGTWDCTWLDSLGNILTSNTNVITADTLKSLAPGIYPVIINGNSGFCNSTYNDTIIILPTAPFSVNALVANVNCIGSSTGIINAKLISGGQAPYSYNWSNGATTSIIQNLIPGVYILVLTDANGCNDTTMYAVQQLSNLFVSFNASTDTLTMANPTITFTNLTTGYSNLSWNFGDGSPLTNNFNPIHTYSASGTFTVELTANDANCMDKKQKLVVILNPTGINSAEINNTINIYGLNDEAVVKFNSDDTKKAVINVYDLSGRLVNTKTCMSSTNRETILLGEANGIYVVQVQLGEKTIIKKLIK